MILNAPLTGRQVVSTRRAPKPKPRSPHSPRSQYSASAFCGYPLVTGNVLQIFASLALSLLIVICGFPALPLNTVRLIKFSDAVLAAQAFQYHADLLLGSGNLLARRRPARRNAQNPTGREPQ
jgi:hypothetical protein